MQELKEAIKRGDIEKPGVINRHVFPLSMGHVWCFKIAGASECGNCFSNKSTLSAPAGQEHRHSSLRTVIDALDGGANLQHCYANGITPLLGVTRIYASCCQVRKKLMKRWNKGDLPKLNRVHWVHVSSALISCDFLWCVVDLVPRQCVEASFGALVWRLRPQFNFFSVSRVKFLTWRRSIHGMITSRKPVFGAAHVHNGSRQCSTSSWMWCRPQKLARWQFQEAVQKDGLTMNDLCAFCAFCAFCALSISQSQHWNRQGEALDAEIRGPAGQNDRWMQAVVSGRSGA